MEGISERSPAAESVTVSDTPAVTPAKRKKTEMKTKSKRETHEARVERALTELNDLLDEHEAELREVKDRVQQALGRAGGLRKALKSSMKEVAQNPELTAELAEYRKKFEALRSLMR
ncbi:MAG: hypothetical protein AAFX94_01140 [Myxococcota bacterium]